MSALEEAWEFFGGDPIPPTFGWVKTKCVIHDESRASASVNLETGKWKCFAGCGRGDLYDLIGLKKGLREFPDQKRFAEEKGWLQEAEAPPQPSSMNPNPRAPKRRGPTKKWKPGWL